MLRIASEPLKALRESEERSVWWQIRAPVMIWMSGPDSSAPTSISHGWSLQPHVRGGVGSGWAEGVHPEDFAEVPGGVR